MMRNTISAFRGVIGLLLLLIVVSGCGSGDPKTTTEPVPKQGEGGAPSAPAVPPAPPKPVTLELASQGAGVTLNEEFQQIVQKAIQQKYPHITLNFNAENGATTLDALMASGQVPDIVVSFNGNLASYREKELVFDMNPLFKEHNVDLNRFEPNYITDVANAGENGELYGLPINVNYHAMYYNKDIFDKFGVPYLENGLYWEDLLEIAPKLSKTDGGVRYRGLDPGAGIVWMSQPLSIASIDPFTDAATVNTEQWKRVFELAKSIFNIPGNEAISTSPKDQFLKDKTLAILLDLNILTQLAVAEAEGLQWDVAQYPSYRERPGYYGNASVYVMIASRSTKHADEVTQLIDLITSEEVQLELSEEGKLSPLRSELVKNSLGANNPYLQGKGLPNIFESKPVSYPIASIYRSKSESILQAQFNQFRDGIIDVNSALRAAEEGINTMVKAEKGGS